MATKTEVRAMACGDLERVVALDAEAGGIVRDDFFQRRWRAMETNPESYLGLIASDPNGVAGFVLGHILTGEFGTRLRLAVIDSIAVSRELRGAGVGAELMKALKAEAKKRHCAEIRTVADWKQQDLLGFFADSDFSPAPVNVLEKPLGGG